MGRLPYEKAEELAKDQDFQDKMTRLYEASPHILVDGYVTNTSDVTLIDGEGVVADEEYVIMLYGRDGDGEPIAVTLFFTDDQKDHLFSNEIKWGFDQ